MMNGMPMTFEGKDTIHSMQGDTGAGFKRTCGGMIAIKQLGTNGGGFFGVNSAHPFENSTYLTNMVENISIILIPIAMVFALGYYLKRKKLALMIFGIMTVGFLCLFIPTLLMEQHGNPEIAKMGVNMNAGAMEGKETRLGTLASAYWSITTTVTSNGSVNAMHDSFMPFQA